MDSVSSKNRIKTNTADISKKIYILYFFMSLLIIFNHSSGYKYFSLDSNRFPDKIVKFLIDWFKTGLFSFTMPAFFFMTGFNYYNNIGMINDVIKKIKRRMKSLLVPYFFWNTFWMFFIIIITFIPFITDKLESLELFEPSAANIFKGIFLFKYNAVYWYMFAIIIMAALSPVIYFCLKNKLIGAAALLFVYVLSIFFGNTKCLRADLYDLLFFMTGGYVSLHYNNLLRFKPEPYARILSCLAFISLSLFQTFNYKESALNVIIVFVMLFCCWNFLDYFENISIMWWMKSTFFVYSFHYYVQQCVNKLICMTLPDFPACALVNFFGGALISFIVSAFAAKILKYYVPGIWKIANGYRE